MLLGVTCLDASKGFTVLFLGVAYLGGTDEHLAVAEEVVGVGVGEVAVAPEGGVVVLQDAARLLRVSGVFVT